MLNVEAITAGVEWNALGRVAAADLEPNEQLGALVGPSPQQGEDPQVSVVLFGVPGWQHGNAELPATAQSITEWADLPPQVRTLGHQGRGVGMRFYTTPEGVKGAAEPYERAGVYRGSLALNRLAFRTGRSMARIVAQRVLLEMVANVLDTDRAVALVHRGLGRVDAAIYDQPAAGRREQRKRGVQPSAGDRLVVVRNPRILFTKLGEVSLR